MTVFYRLCGIPSTNPSPIFQEDKYALNRLCLKSFREAFRKVKPNVLFIADFCGGEYKDLIRETIPFNWKYVPTEIGIMETCLLQYEMAKQSNDDVFLFQECDYLYRPNTGEQLEEAIKTLKLVSPYDHLNYYIDKSIHSNEVKLELVGGEHYRTAERDTMTFGMTKEAFTANYEILKKWGYLDNEVWKEMRENGYPLYVPIPSIATHCVRDFMAPSIDWEEIWSSIL